VSALPLIHRHQIGIESGGQFVAPRDALVSVLFDHRECIVARPLCVSQFTFQCIDRDEFVGLLGLQLFATLHHLQQ
jgi:hypothetical protein